MAYRSNSVFSSFHAYTHTHVSFPCYVYHTGIKVAAEAKPVPHKSFADYCGAVLSFLPSSESWSHFAVTFLSKNHRYKTYFVPSSASVKYSPSTFSRQNLKVSYRFYANAPSLHFPFKMSGKFHFSRSSRGPSFVSNRMAPLARY